MLALLHTCRLERFCLLCRKKARQSYGFGEEAKQIEMAQAQVSEGLSSSVFKITTPASIPADNSGHKVDYKINVFVAAVSQEYLSMCLLKHCCANYALLVIILGLCSHG